jgi:hypothetical protein
MASASPSPVAPTVPVHGIQIVVGTVYSPPFTRVYVGPVQSAFTILMAEDTVALALGAVPAGTTLDLCIQEVTAATTITGCFGFWG